LKCISEEYDRLINFRLVFIKSPLQDAKVEAIFIPNEARETELEVFAEDPTKCHLIYSSYWCQWCLVSHKEWQAEKDTYIAEK
jgi:hypothetical protein